MREVMALGYVIVSAENLDEWATFAREALGLQAGAVPAGMDTETLFYRVDERSWRFAVEHGEDGGAVALGFEVATEADLDQLCARLETAGVPTKDAPDVAALRRVRKLVQVTDPSGVPLEFFCGADIAPTPFVSPTGARFVTGAQGLGHVVVSVSDLEASQAFYLDLLGFRLTDVITVGGMFDIYFTSPNRRHHSLGYLCPPGAPGGRIEHIMFEVDELDVVGRALDWCLDHKLKMRSLLGKHTNDYMISFYTHSPSGLAVEYGWGGREIDPDNYQVSHYDTSSSWGHRPPSGRSIEEELRVLFGASPGGGAEPADAAAGRS